MNRISGRIANRNSRRRVASNSNRGRVAVALAA